LFTWKEEKMPDNPKPDLTAYIALLKLELSEHAQKERKEFLDSVFEDLKENCYENVRIIKEGWTDARDKVNNFISEKVNEEIARLHAVSKELENTLHQNYEEHRHRLKHDALMYKEYLSDHCKKEIESMKSIIQEFLVEELVDAKKEIRKGADEEIARLKHHAVMYNEYITEHADKEIDRITLRSQLLANSYYEMIDKPKHCSFCGTSININDPEATFTNCARCEADLKTIAKMNGN
jgi:hypothetical protein